MHDARCLALLLLLVGCGSGTDSPAVEAPADTSVGRPALTTPHPDTLVASADLRCANAVEVHVNYYIGANPRVVVSTQDTGMILPQRESASGARYANDDASTAWWNKGDSAAFTFRGSTTTCGPAEGLVF